MANKLISMQQLRQIYRLYKKGWSKSKISKQLQLSRNTVKRYLKFVDSGIYAFDDLLGLSEELLYALYQGSSQKLSSKVQAF